MSQDVISRAELGRIDALPLRSLRRIAFGLGADLVITLRWRGGEIDRLLDEGHASLVGAVVAMLISAGWIVQPEVSYSEYGERGSIDLLAWHAPTRTLLVIEVKTELTSLEAMLRKLDEKVRLAPTIAFKRFSWSAGRVGHLLILPAGTTPRRHVDRHAGVLDRVFPMRGAQLRRWIASPAGPFGGIWFVPVTQAGRARSGGVGSNRIRVTSRDAGERDSAQPSSSGATNDARPA